MDGPNLKTISPAAAEDGPGSPWNSFGRHLRFNHHFAFGDIEPRARRRRGESKQQRLRNRLRIWSRARGRGLVPQFGALREGVGSLSPRDRADGILSEVGAQLQVWSERAPEWIQPGGINRLATYDGVTQYQPFVYVVAIYGS